MTSYVADAPISDPNDDRFNRWPFAKRIADTIASRRDPSSLVVAIYGAWGDGKTTVLNFLNRELSQLDNIVIIRFNPWQFPDEVALLRSFFAVLSKTLNVKLSTEKEELGKALAKYGSFLDLLKSGVGGAVQSAGEILGNIDIDEEKRRVAEILSRNNRKVVILMDDIDRLEKAEIQAVFKLVKLTADFQNTSYVLAFDADMVASAIGERFTAEEGKRFQAGHSFLEKIVQVPLDLPAVPVDALRSFCFEAIEEAVRSADVTLSEAQIIEFAGLFIDGLGIRVKTPRMAKRYANAIAFALAINKGEVNPIDLMLIEGIRVFYPKAYGVIRRNKDVLTSGSSNLDGSNERAGLRAKFQNELSEGLLSDEAKALLSLVQSLFPRFGGTIYGKDFDGEWAKTQRAASFDYFNRYFTYSVPETDVADKTISSLLASLESSSVEENESALKAIIKPANVGIVLSKLKPKAKELSSKAAASLAIAVSRNGELFPATDSFFFMNQPIVQAAFLVSNLLRQVETSKRYELAEILSREAEPLRFAIEVVSRISSRNSTSPDKRILTKEEDGQLWQGLGRRIRDYVSTKGKLIFDEPKNAARYLESWLAGGGEAEVLDFLTKDFDDNPEDAILLISGLLPIAYSTSGIEPGEFTRDTYNRVARLITPSALHDSVIKLFGEQVAIPVYDGPSDRKLELTIAHQFEYVHNAVLAEAQEQRVQPTSGNSPQ